MYRSGSFCSLKPVTLKSLNRCWKDAESNHWYVSWDFLRDDKEVVWYKIDFCFCCLERYINRQGNHSIYYVTYAWATLSWMMGLLFILAASVGSLIIVHNEGKNDIIVNIKEPSNIDIDKTPLHLAKGAFRQVCNLVCYNICTRFPWIHRYYIFLSSRL